jgi:hypothetical protein
MAFATTVIPENLQWWGIGRELVSGTPVAPVITVPLEKGQPDDKPTMIVDKSLRGYMGEDYGDIQGTEIADLPLSGDVYLDTIGHLLYNLWGDYQASGTTGSPTWTASTGVAQGASAITVTTGSVAVAGTAVQIGTTGVAPCEVCIVGVGSTSTSIVLSAATPTRFAHTGSTTVTTVTAPFTHTFSLLNGGGAFGSQVDAQPPSHTITYHNNLAASTLARQYAYWCASGIDFKMNAEQLFQHDTKGMSILGVVAGSNPTNTQGTATAVANWNFKVGIGGPASGGTLVNTVEDATVNLARMLKVKFTMDGNQQPWVIARLGLSTTGKLSFVAQDESPLTTLLANTQQPLQLAMTQGSGASLLACTFNFNLAAYESAPITAPDVLGYDVSFRGLMNTTNAGASGGMSPGNVVIQNAVPTY